MTTASAHDAGKVCAVSAVSWSATIAVVAGMVAACVAAGSAGLLGDPLRHGLTAILLALAVVAGWPRRSLAFGEWTLLAGAIVVVAAVNFLGLSAVDVLAVALLLAVLAWMQTGLASRAMLAGAMATGLLGLFRLATDSIPAVWLAADALGGALGLWAGWLSGQPLWVGRSFGGVDLLVLMTGLYAGWLAWTAPPRVPRAIYAAAAILTGHLIYLMLLSYCHDLLAALPAVVMPPPIPDSHLGVWAWGNAMRTLVPWNVPLVAVAIHALIATAMFRWAPWVSVDEATTDKGQPNGTVPPSRQRRQDRGSPREQSLPLAPSLPPWLRLGPLVLAALLPFVTVLGLSRSDLKNKTIVAYEKGDVDWSKPQHDKPAGRSVRMYGMLPVLVESLGGRFVRSADLSQQDLAQADVLLLIHPDRPWQEGQKERVLEFVRGGGSLLVAAGPRSRQDAADNAVDDLLRPTGLEVRYDTAMAKADRWDDSLEPLAHPATVGVGQGRTGFGVAMGSSVRTNWPACPLLVGRWGWAEPGSDAVSTGVARWDPGERLGDLVLVAQQHVGRGTVVVLGDAMALSNEVTAGAYAFTGRLLGCLAGKHGDPQAWWRQLIGILLLAGVVGLLVRAADSRLLAETVAVLGAAVISCSAATHKASDVLPDGRGQSQFKLAYVDGSHLEAYHSELWHEDGIGGLLQTLMRDGYLPLVLPEVTAERLSRADLLISIAPARAFSPPELKAVQDFVQSGGTFISTVGAEEARPSRDLLALFDMDVPLSPVPPTEKVYEPAPLGSFRQTFVESSDTKAYVEFYAAWPVSGGADCKAMVAWSDGTHDRPVIVSRALGQGHAVLIGDTSFAANKNLNTGSITDPSRDNGMFWRWLFSSLSGGRRWVPPKPKPADVMAPDETLADPSKEVSP